MKQIIINKDILNRIHRQNTASSDYNAVTTAVIFFKNFIKPLLLIFIKVDT